MKRTIPTARFAIGSTFYCTQKLIVEYAPEVPGLSVGGLSAAGAKALLERVKAAFDASGFVMPHGGIVIRLTPANISARCLCDFYDLPVALGILAVTGQARITDLARQRIGGRLSSDGKVVDGEVTHLDAKIKVASTLAKAVEAYVKNGDKSNEQTLF